MGRLIDADELLQEIEESANAVEVQIHLGKCNKDVAKGMLSGLALVRENILRKATAFDVEQVISDLEREKMIICGCHMIETNIIRIDDAIEIVRKGGMNG